MLTPRLGVGLVAAWAATWQPLLAQRARPPAGGTAAPVAAITPQLIESSVRFLSDDLLEGRAPGTRGGDLAARYLASQLAALGLRPAASDGSFYQWVSMVGLTSEASVVVGAQRGTLVLDPGSDIVVWPERGDSLTTLDADLVFAGYGISAPEWGWDDYKGAAQTGRIVMVLPSEPRAGDSVAFNGTALTEHGLWQRKLEQAARMGAVGVLLVHAPDAVPLTWAAVRNTWSGERLLPDRPPIQSLRFAAWITAEAARRVIEATGKDYALLMRRAESRDFRPVDLGGRAAVDLHSKVRRFRSPNVIATLEGADSLGRNEGVLVTAHYDGLGIGYPEAGDSIYNGAVDDASGVGVLLAAATAVSRAPAAPRRTIVFLAATGTEAGGLGTLTYLAQPAIPLSRTVAVLGVERGNVWGPTRDVVALGAELSTLGNWVATAVQSDSLQVAADPNPQAGTLNRSDQLLFARAGVPIALLLPGPAYVDRDTAWGPGQWKTYVTARYHRPSDEIRPEFDYRGLVQEARILTRLVWLLAESSEFPSWRPDAPFRSAGQRLRQVP